jgi:hypothetical protein
VMHTAPGPRMVVPETRCLALAADPLRPSAGGAELDVATSGTLCRFVTAHARAPFLALAQATRLSSGYLLSHAARTPLDTNPLEQVPGLSPGRLPSARFSTLRPSEEIRGPSYVLAKLLAPLSPDSFVAPSSRACRRFALPRSASVCLSALLGSSGKMLLTDLCNRLTIRAPVNRSITERTTCVVPTPQALPLAGGSKPKPRIPTSVRPAWRRTILRQSDPGWPRT